MKAKKLIANALAPAANKTAEKFGYAVQFSEIGDVDETHGAPTQMGVFNLCQ